MGSSGVAVRKATDHRDQFGTGRGKIHALFGQSEKYRRGRERHDKVGAVLGCGLAISRIRASGTPALEAGWCITPSSVLRGRRDVLRNLYSGCYSPNAASIYHFILTFEFVSFLFFSHVGWI